MTDRIYLVSTSAGYTDDLLAGFATTREEIHQIVAQHLITDHGLDPAEFDLDVNLGDREVYHWEYGYVERVYYIHEIKRVQTND